jgi:hypothetical protein
MFGVLSSMMVFSGGLCLTDNYGDITTTNTQPLEQPFTRSVKMVKAIAGPGFEWTWPWLYRFYLLESEGELLLVNSGRVEDSQQVV